MKNRDLVQCFVGVFAIMMTVSVAGAQITVEDSGAVAIGGWATGSHTVTDADLGNLDLSNADKLVVCVLFKGGTAYSASSVKYGGVDMTYATSHGGPSAYGYIYYLDSPGSTVGDLTWTGGGYGVGVTVSVLSGTQTGVGATNASATASTSLTTTGVNSLVVASVTKLSSDTLPAGQGLLSDGPGAVVPYGSPGTAFRTAYQTVAAAGSVTPTFDIGDATVAAEFFATAGPAPTPGTLIYGK